MISDDRFICYILLHDIKSLLVLEDASPRELLLQLPLVGKLIRFPTRSIGALIIRIGFEGILYYNYIKVPPKPCSNY